MPYNFYVINPHRNRKLHLALAFSLLISLFSHNTLAKFCCQCFCLKKKEGGSEGGRERKKNNLRLANGDLGNLGIRRKRKNLDFIKTARVSTGLGDMVRSCQLEGQGSMAELKLRGGVSSPGHGHCWEHLRWLFLILNY